MSTSIPTPTRAPTRASNEARRAAAAASPAGFTGTRRVSWRVIAVKELRELLVTGRFQAAAALVFGLLAVTLALSARSYARALAEFGVAEGARLESLRQHGHLNRATMWMPAARPEPLPSLVSGTGDGAATGWLDVDGLAMAYPPADMLLIVGVVLSLVAVLFAHDAFTGERERGTLRLLVSGAASRAAIVGGKLAGRYAALLIPLLAGLLAGAVAVAVSSDIGWSRADTSAFLVLAAFCMLFVGVFVALGMLVSAWTRGTHASLGLALLAWAAFVLVIPSVAPYAAAAITPTGNLALHQRERHIIMDSERDALIEVLRREWQAPVRQAHPELAAYSALPAEARAAARAADPGLSSVLARLEAIADSASAEANRRQMEKRTRLDAAFDARRDAQVRLTAAIASTSPYAALVLASLDLSDTGPRAGIRRRQQRQQWHDETFMPWLYATMDSARASNPSIHWNARLELPDVPHFRYAPEPVAARTAAALPQAGSLLGLGLAFVILGLVGFRSYDVR
jgi:ABC-type transport system involved in multi-copper enzyme maturation permease subunit